MSLAPLDDEDERPIRIAIVNDFPLVIAGTARALADYPEQVVVVEYDSQTLVQRQVDVVLYDWFAATTDLEAIVPQLVAAASARLVIFSWLTDPQRVAESLRAGASGVISKSVSPGELVEAIQRVHRGEYVVPTHSGTEQQFGRWPGDDIGLTSRESEVLILICQGHSNQSISETMFLGSNTVKSYIRTLYRKIDVETRTQAVLWGVDNGFRPQRVRVFPK